MFYPLILLSSCKPFVCLQGHVKVKVKFKINLCGPNVAPQLLLYYNHSHSFIKYVTVNLLQLLELQRPESYNDSRITTTRWLQRLDSYNDSRVTRSLNFSIVNLIN